MLFIHNKSRLPEFIPHEKNIAFSYSELTERSLPLDKKRPVFLYTGEIHI